MIEPFEYRLEFNEQQQNFHQERKSPWQEAPYTHGWVTIDDDYDDATQTAFINSIEGRYGRKRLRA